MLRDGSAISDDVIAARGYSTVTDPKDLLDLGFATAQRRVPGLLLPLHATNGSVALYIYRPDNPRTLTDQAGRHRTLKYEAPKGCGTRLDCPPVCQPMLADPSTPLWITEGQKKGDCLASHGLCALVLLGVWNWRGRGGTGGTTFLADWDYVGLDGRDVRIVFDSDVMVKASVRKALDRLMDHLERRGASVTSVYLPNAPDGTKVGVDDYLAAGHTIQELDAMVEAPRPAPRAAAAKVRLLDAPPAIIRRPLCIVEDHAYAAIWPYCEITETETTNARGEVVVLTPPRVTKARRLFIVRDDGVIFGEGGDQPMEDLGIDVVLPEVPPPDRLWSLPAVRAYRAGHRPDPADVFKRVADVIDHYIDFSRSLASQRTMAEMLACYVLSTWLLDAFDVAAFIWPNGDRGTGKTKAMLTITQMAYLGIVVLAGGSYASLRDLADYGACIGFDDAENLSDKSTDPDKRALLLAGNRRGAQISVKEAQADKKWRTRYVDAFCPRMFTAIKVPDAVLASRSIVVPLVRTGDRGKANSEPMDANTWPHDRSGLLDDLWAFGLAHLTEMAPYETKAVAHAPIAGRNLEPWRAILAVALFLQDHGVKDLYASMCALATAYQTERPDLELADPVTLVLKAIRHVATYATFAINLESKTFFDVSSTEISDKLVTIAQDEEVDIEWMGEAGARSMHVGRILARLRFQKKAHGKGPREWRIKGDELCKLLTSYGLPPSVSGASGAGGEVAQGEQDIEGDIQTQQGTCRSMQAPHFGETGSSVGIAAKKTACTPVERKPARG